jgi:hypothetical protein
MGTVTQRLAAAAMRAGAKIHTGRAVSRCWGAWQHQLRCPCIWAGRPPYANMQPRG